MAGRERERAESGQKRSGGIEARSGWTRSGASFCWKWLRDAQIEAAAIRRRQVGATPGLVVRLRDPAQYF